MKAQYQEQIICRTGVLLQNTDIYNEIKVKMINHTFRLNTKKMGFFDNCKKTEEGDNKQNC